MIDIDFSEIEDEFISCIEDGLTREDIADGYGYDREEFNDFIESNQYAIQEERRAKFKLKRELLKVAKTKGTTKALQEFFGSDTPSLTIEFKRGDMRTPDEITITNTEGVEKKSLSRLYSEDSLKSS